MGLRANADVSAESRKRSRAAREQAVNRWVEPLEGRLMLSAGSVVINEINYNPPDKTNPTEFVELTNPGTTDVDLSGATFAKGLTYTFPAGTTLPAGGYLVVSANPAKLQAAYGVSSLGPFDGKLSNDGEDIQLQDSVGNVLDEVDYGAAFPWPIIGDSPGPGYSIELINPDLDNNLGGNWRAFTPTPSTQVTLFNSGSQWDYRKGTAEASSPTDLWRNLYYTEDGNWTANAAAPIGYDPTLAMGTKLADMAGTYTSFSLRKIFYIPDQSEAQALTLQAKYDDGINVWINGHLVQSSNTSSGNLAFNATASADREDSSFQSFAIPTTFLLPGDNQIAVQVFNSSISSDDAFFDAKLIETTGTGGPTPGRQNSVFAANAAPAMRQVTNTPLMPTAGQTVTVTAKVTDPDGVASVGLSYQVVDAGNYIAREDAAYNNAANWTTVAMHDDGLNGDATAGDGVYSVVLPASVQVNRRLVRYRITSADTLGNTITGPYQDDPVPNFAYYVYNGIPSYSAALHPGAGDSTGTVVSYPASVLNSIPVVQLITKQQDHDNSQHIRTATIPGYTGSENAWSGTLVYNGVVYDDIHYRARGGVWRYAMGKNMWKIDFENGHDFQAYYADGTPYPVKWKKLDLGANIQQGDIGMRGEQGLFETLSFELFNMAGVAAPATIPMEMRIVDNATETGATQYDTDFQGMYLAVEQMVGRFLDAHGLPDGNLYKMEGGTGGGGGSSNNQGPTQPTDNSDLVSFVNTLAGNPTDQWIQDNVDLPEFYSFQAVVEMIHHWDIGFGKNYFYYHNPTTNKWDILPWDTDLTWYVNYEPTNGDIDPFAKYILNRSTFQLQYRDRVRELRDLLFTNEQIGALADAYANLVNPPGGPTMIGADAAMWDYNPIMSSSLVNSSKSGAGRYYVGGIPTKDFPGMVSHLKLWTATRAVFIDQKVLTPADEAAAPLKPLVSYTGPTNFPANQLAFSTGAFAPGSAGGTFAAMQWRVADVTVVPGQPPKSEINAAWDSGVISTYSPTITVPSGAVIAGHTYRVRVRMLDSNGRWSHWSDVTFGITQFVVSTASSIVRDLRLTELNYDPAKPAAGSPYNNDDFEFVEFKNFGSQILDLTGLQFTDGITYTLGPATLVPGQVGVIVKNLPAFRSRYGPGPLVLGDYLSTAQSFSNSGEHVAVLDASGQSIADFTYGTSLAAAHGGGASLEVIDPVIGPDLNVAANWRASTITNGTPGAENSITLTAPTNATATAATTTQASIRWTDNESAEQGYLVFRRTVGTAQFAQIATLPPNSTTFVDNNAGAGLTPGTSYEYRIQAYAASGYSNYVAVIVPTLTTTPINLSATNIGNAISLAWNTTSGAVSYNVYRGTAPGGEGLLPIATGLISAAFADVNVTPGTTFYYVVTATSAGGAQSARSSEASAITIPLGTVIGTSGSFNNSGNTIAKVFDGDLNTYFDAPSPGNGDWAGLDFGAPAVITKISYAPRSGFTSRMVNGIFQASNSADFSGAVNLFTVTAAPVAGVLTSVTINNLTPFRYVRYLAPDGTFGNIAELQVSRQVATSVLNLGASNDSLYLKQNADGLHVDYWLNSASPGVGTPTGQVLGGYGLQIHGLGGADAITVDQSNGRLLSTVDGSNTIDTTAGGSISLTLIGTTSIDTLQLDGASNELTLNGDTIALPAGAVAGISFTDGGGNDSLSVTGAIPLTLNLGNGRDALNVAGGANAIVNFGAASGDLIINGNGNTSLIIGPSEPNVQFGSSAAMLATTIAAPATPIGMITGNIFNDANGNGKISAGEKGLKGRYVFIDANNNGKLDRGERVTQTDANGNFTFAGLAPGKYHVRQLSPPGWRGTTPNSYVVTIRPGATLVKLLFGQRQRVG
ncbi:MAG TPA: lamin tail domain-containing protein [Humisphaera sp.]|jgi:hypothetical protein|nr:lamin tail domain-containing protein [Humisphaera sp.]